MKFDEWSLRKIAKEMLSGWRVKLVRCGGITPVNEIALPNGSVGFVCSSGGELGDLVEVRFPELGGVTFMCDWRELFPTVFQSCNVNFPRS